jgi:hypothetical protein
MIRTAQPNRRAVPLGLGQLSESDSFFRVQKILLRPLCISLMLNGGGLVSTVGWGTVSTLQSGTLQHHSQELIDPRSVSGHGQSMLDHWSTLHGWTGVGIDIDQSLLPALVVSSLTPGCSAQKCGAIMRGDQVRMQTHGTALRF